MGTESEVAHQCGADPNLGGQHDTGVPERLTEQAGSRCAADAVGAAERPAAEVLAGGAARAVPQQARVVSQFVTGAG